MKILIFFIKKQNNIFNELINLWENYQAEFSQLMPIKVLLTSNLLESKL